MDKNRQASTLAIMSGLKECGYNDNENPFMIGIYNKNKMNSNLNTSRIEKIDKNLFYKEKQTTTPNKRSNNIRIKIMANNVRRFIHGDTGPYPNRDISTNANSKPPVADKFKIPMPNNFQRVIVFDRNKINIPSTIVNCNKTTASASNSIQKNIENKKMPSDIQKTMGSTILEIAKPGVILIPKVGEKNVSVGQGSVQEFKADVTGFTKIKYVG